VKISTTGSRSFRFQYRPCATGREDIPLLAGRYLAAYAKSSGKGIAGFDADAIDALMRFDWPGNVRQLRNEIARAVALAADGQTIARARICGRR
jgi:DNA-binding NtrC family response regulator